MNRKEYTLLLENWNNFLIKEEKKLIQEQLLIESIILSEGLLELSRKFSPKIAIGLLVLNFLKLSLSDYNQAKPNHIAFAAEKIGVEKKTAQDAVKEFEKLSDRQIEELENFSEEDVNKKNIISKLISKLFSESFEQAIENTDVSILKGFYSKKVYDTWKNRTYENNIILDEIIKVIKEKSELKTFKLEDNTEVIIYAFKDRKKLSEQISNYMIDEVIIPSINIKSSLGDNPEEIIAAIKKETRKLINSYILPDYTKTAGGKCFDYKVLQSEIMENLNKPEYDAVFKNVNIKLNPAKGGIIGLEADDESSINYVRNTLIHELGHSLQNLDNFHMAHRFLSYLKYEFKKPHYKDIKNLDITLEKKLFFNFMIEEVAYKLNLKVNLVWQSLNKEGQEKIVKNVKNLINYLKGGNLIEFRNNNFYLTVDIDDHKRVYFHMLEERIENLGDWARIVTKKAKRSGHEETVEIPLKLLKKVKENLKKELDYSFKEKIKTITKAFSKEALEKYGKEKLAKKMAIRTIDIEDIYLLSCSNLGLITRFQNDRSYLLFENLVHRSIMKNNYFKEIDNLIKILEETNNSLHDHENHNH